MTQLLLVDDHTLVRSGFQLILEAQEDITVIAEAKNGEKALDYLMTAPHPDLILSDMHMDGMAGLQFITTVKKLYPGINIIVLSMDDSIQTVSQALQSGADGYLLKSSHLEEILFAIQHVQRGDKYISSSLGVNIINNVRHLLLPEYNKKEMMKLYDISERELSVLELISEGYTNAEIAEKIYLSKRTVEGYRQLLIEKAKVPNTAGLVRFGFQNKLLS